MVPSPNRPYALYPQANNIPSERIATVCIEPAATAAQLLLPICTGLLLSTVVPSPNCPLGLYPQANNIPPDLIATV